MKIKALIVDDEAPARSELRYMLQETSDVEVVGEAANADEAIKLIKALNYDVVFVDIQMQGLTGLQLAEITKELSLPPAVVFVTAYGEYAVKAFELNALDYLVKPFEEKRLVQTIEKVSRYKASLEGLEHKKKIKSGKAELDLLPVQENDKTILISIDNIVYIHAQNERIFVHATGGVYSTSFNLKELESRFSNRGFFRTHRSYLVNIYKAKEIIPMFHGSFILRLSGEIKVPVSRRKASELKSILGM
ncbi:LytTR family transcriptional regulator DNA-binding domain-containing protein [Candidatus Oleimmundimicrobium sp.]|uniref:LytR/AlgR family response regulator transcription factor n=1 Tax=Candidatus Oleimmundimicrobium sp. TaxID=3060597 RepID=UPI002722D767|nr:LytTR family transcriptional regulator DNA-binding domain-containing protein [Candidatus Oleimmundimicrobium sp.]MDO8886249.1 LytTR family transcriptional regulator DNA-binding domain-containing protein [Candidatus Oleimmundimicrobium sp.]